MNKLDLIATLKNEAELTKSEAAAVVDIFFDQISTALSEGDRVEIRGLCSFYVKKYKAYAGRNPKTGERVEVAPQKIAVFQMRDGIEEPGGLFINGINGIIFL